MRSETRKVKQAARVLTAAAAAAVAISTLSGCDVLYSQLHGAVPHDHSHDHDH